ncbi:uncharacterized protein LOC144706631 [Wolffia australiana]
MATEVLLGGQRAALNFSRRRRVGGLKRQRPARAEPGGSPAGSGRSGPGPGRGRGMARGRETYAGPAFSASSPSPGELPLPTFWSMTETDDVARRSSATVDLRRLLRLDQ